MQSDEVGLGGHQRPQQPQRIQGVRRICVRSITFCEIRAAWQAGMGMYWARDGAGLSRQRVCTVPRHVTAEGDSVIHSDLVKKKKKRVLDIGPCRHVDREVEARPGCLHRARRCLIMTCRRYVYFELDRQQSEGRGCVPDASSDRIQFNSRRHPQPYRQATACCRVGLILPSQGGTGASCVVSMTPWWVLAVVAAASWSGRCKVGCECACPLKRAGCMHAHKQTYMRRR